MPIIKIDNIFGGIAPTHYFAQPGQYNSAIAIDPDWAIADSGTGSVRTSGLLRPTSFAEFSGATLTGNPYWIITNPKDSLVYVYSNNGRIVSYSSSFASETLVGTATSSSGNGAFYYNNWLYFFTNTDVSRYGPLDGTPTLTNTVWTGSTLGTQTALVNTTYPSIRGSGVYPNHAAHLHNDNKLYFCDFDSTSSTAANRNKGLIHYISTTFSTNEGQGNNSSTYNALDLPLGYYPIDIESYGNDLVIAAFQGTTNTTILQGKAALFFWDTTASSFYRMVPLEDPFISALLFVNGVLYVFSGQLGAANGAGNGWRISQYMGGNTLQTIFRSEEGFPPLAGAVDSLGDRISWGTNITYPENFAVVMSYGSYKGNLPKTIHCVATADAAASATDGMTTSLKYVEQVSGSLPRPIIGWRDASNVGIDNISTTYGTSVWRSQTYNIGHPFKISKVIIPLGVAVGANMTLIPTIFVDNLSTSTALTTINNTNYASSERIIKLLPGISGKHDFLLQLRWTGTALLPVGLPIEIEIEIIGE